MKDIAMRKKMIICATCAMSMLFVTEKQSVASNALQVSGNRYWLSVASRQSINEAIGIARYYAGWSKTPARVVRSENGWFAVVLGPETVNDPETFLQERKISTLPAYPKDIQLSRGEKFVEEVWTLKNSKPLASAKFDGEKPVSLSHQDLQIKLDADKLASGERVPTATGYRFGDQIFAMRMPEDHADTEATSNVAIFKLDSQSRGPQVVFSYFWNGAHCCTVTKIASLDYGGNWRVIQGQTLDADGYHIHDIDGDGFSELISTDNSFQYAFASYAESFAPLQISKVENGKIAIVTWDSRFRSYLLQEAARLEFAATLDSSLWRSNGFLGAWVAAKSLVGEGEAAWAKMLTSYDRNSDWTMEECLVEQSNGICPDKDIRKLSFPQALKKALIRGNYPMDYSQIVVPEPRKVRGTDNVWGAETLLEVCARSLGTVRKIIAKMLTGLDDPSEFWQKAIAVEDSATVDKYEDKLSRLTCSVSYKANLQQLIGVLAAAGRMRFANQLNGLRRRVGPTLSNRVKFTVQPTSKPGVTWIKLLP